MLRVEERRIGFFLLEESAGKETLRLLRVRRLRGELLFGTFTAETQSALRLRSKTIFPTDPFSQEGGAVGEALKTGHFRLRRKLRAGPVRVIDASLCSSRR